jgi:glutathione S-transferase
VSLTIWGRLSSVNVQKVVWCADELGIEYKRIDAGGKFGLVDTPAYLGMNPNGLVPVIDDDGFVLYESNAIVRYLACKAGATSMWPEEPRARADVDRWMEWQSTGYTPAMGPAFMQLIRTAPDKRDIGTIEASRVKSEKLSAILDTHLCDRRFVTGERFTVADIVIGCAAHRWLHIPIERTARPNLQRWYDEIAARPAAQQVTSQKPLT